MSLTQVARKYRISRATVCRLVNESAELKKSAGDQETVVPATEASDLPTAA
jgi:hypothetical protein